MFQVTEFRPLFHKPIRNQYLGVPHGDKRWRVVPSSHRTLPVDTFRQSGALWGMNSML